MSFLKRLIKRGDGKVIASSGMKSTDGMDNAAPMKSKDFSSDKEPPVQKRSHANCLHSQIAMHEVLFMADDRLAGSCRLEAPLYSSREPVSIEQLCRKRRRA